MQVANTGISFPASLETPVQCKIAAPTSPNSWLALIRHSVLLKEECNAVSFPSLCFQLKAEAPKAGASLSLSLLCCNQCKARKVNCSYQKRCMLQKRVLQTLPQSETMWGIGNHIIHQNGQSQNLKQWKY